MLLTKPDLATLFICALLVHLICDWFLQNKWQVFNKIKLAHPAAWFHSGLHTIGFALIFPLPVALLLGLSHIIIDTRVPLNVWRRLIKQDTLPESLEPTATAVYMSFAMWQDQAAHLILLCVAALYCK